MKFLVIFPLGDSNINVRNRFIENPLYTISI